MEPDTVNGTVCNRWNGKGCEHAQLIVDAIDATPCPMGTETPAVIRASVFNINMTVYSDALARKLACGVQVHYLTFVGDDDDGEPAVTNAVTKLVRASIAGHRGSWFKECRWSCYDTRRTGSTHQKFWLFSSSGGRRWLTINDSGNASQGADTSMFIDYTAVYDRCLHDGLARRIDAGRADRKSKLPTTVKTCDKSRIMHLSPGSSNAAADLLHGTKYAPGCRAELDMHLTTLTAPVKEMARLQRAGCTTRALVNWHKYTWAAHPSKALMARTRQLVSSGVPTYDVSWVLPSYNHRMTTIAHGSMHGHVRARMMSGSTNQTNESFRSANALLESRVAADVDAAWQGSDQMAQLSHLLTPADVGCVGTRQPKGC